MNEKSQITQERPYSEERKNIRNHERSSRTAERTMKLRQQRRAAGSSGRRRETENTITR
jgi:hypothetical protein